jgi:hypothetical protein
MRDAAPGHDGKFGSLPNFFGNLFKHVIREAVALCAQLQEPLAEGF